MEVYPIEDCPAEVYIVAGAKFEREKIVLIHTAEGFASFAQSL